MRVLHVNDRLSNRGGTDLFLQSVIANTPGEHGLAVGREDGTARLSAPVFQVSGLDSRTARPVDLTGALTQFQPDVLHIHNVMNPTALQALSQQPSLVTVHDHRFFCPGKGKWTLSGASCTATASPEACKDCFEDTNYFHSISALTEQRLEAIRRIPATVLSKYMRRELEGVGVRVTHVIPPCIPTLPSPTGPLKPPCVLFVGRLVEAKGVWDAVSAWRRAELELPLVFVGTGSARKALEAEGFQVTGWVEREELAAWYQAAKALLFPPRWQEPFGIVGIEGLAAGIPVVSWDSGGIPEWHPGEHLVPYGDVEKLGDALAQALASKPLSPFAPIPPNIFGKHWFEAYEETLKAHVHTASTVKT